MAVAYNAWTTLTRIYQDDGGVFGSNQAAASAFDLFPDDVAIDDALYFGRYSSTGNKWQYGFRNLQFYVGTALAAASITLVWEFWDGSAWTALTGVTDNTSQFTATGQNSVSWTMPTTWRTTSVNGVTAWWVRCRVSAVSAPAEGGAQSIQIVQCGNNTIVVTGTGNSFATIETADIAGGWGVFTQAGLWYSCNAQLQIGDGSTTTALTDTRKVIYFHWYFEVKSAATLTLGAISSAHTYDGCILYGAQELQSGEYAHDTDGFTLGGTVYLYRSIVEMYSGGCAVKLSGVITATDTAFGKQMGYLTISNASSVFTRCSFSVRENILVAEATFTLCIFASTSSLQGNLTLVGCTFTSLRLSGWYGSVTAVLLGCTYTSFAETGGGSPAILTTHEKQYFDLTVLDAAGDPIAGASVEIVDATAATVFSGTSDANGEIAQQQLVQQSRVWPAPSGPEVITAKTPHTVTVAADGYNDYVMIMEMDQARDEIVVMSTGGSVIVIED